MDKHNMLYLQRSPGVFCLPGLISICRCTVSLPGRESRPRAVCAPAARARQKISAARLAPGRLVHASAGSPGPRTHPHPCIRAPSPSRQICEIRPPDGLIRSSADKEDPLICDLAKEPATGNRDLRLWRRTRLAPESITSSRAQAAPGLGA